LSSQQRREFQRREAILEQTNADLSSALAQAQRKVLELTSSASAAASAAGGDDDGKRKRGLSWSLYRFPVFL